MNLNVVTASVIAISIFFSLLFLSFAIVSMNIIVKHSRTYSKIKQEVIRGLERYTSKVFIVLIIFTAIVLAVNVITYIYDSSLAGVTTSLAGLALTPFLFYAPSSIVIDEYSIKRSVQASLKFFFKRFDYFLLWLVLTIAVITIFDFVFIAASGTVYSRYVLLVFNSLFILPFLVILQSEFYMKRFPLLKS